LENPKLVWFGNILITSLRGYKQKEDKIKKGQDKNPAPFLKSNIL